MLDCDIPPYIGVYNHLQLIINQEGFWTVCSLVGFMKISWDVHPSTKQVWVDSWVDDLFNPSPQRPHEVLKTWDLSFWFLYVSMKLSGICNCFQDIPNSQLWVKHGQTSTSWGCWTRARIPKAKINPSIFFETRMGRQQFCHISWRRWLWRARTLKFRRPQTKCPGRPINCQIPAGPNQVGHGPKSK